MSFISLFVLVTYPGKAIAGLTDWARSLCKAANRTRGPLNLPSRWTHRDKSVIFLSSYTLTWWAQVSPKVYLVLHTSDLRPTKLVWQRLASLSLQT